MDKKAHQTIEDIAKYCFEKIQLQNKRPINVAITGDSGSGKSFYAKLICKQFDQHDFDYNYIDHDKFLISREDRAPLKDMYYEKGEFKGKSYWEILENWFYLDTYYEVIHKLKRGKPVSFYPYKREFGAPDDQPMTIYPKDFNIFDTTLMTQYMDFVIMIDVEMDTIIKRKLDRDSDLRTDEEIIEMHKKVQGYCWERVRPENPNIVIDNNNFEAPFIVGQ